MTISKSQVDKLGDRLRKNVITETDIKMLNDYRLSYGEAYKSVITIIRKKLKLEPTGRPEKSNSSIIEKLHREHIRLSQMQDIAGCRLIVSNNLEEQNSVICSLESAFLSSIVIDRRIKPSYGYRAVHLIVKQFGKIIEVQVRTEFQHQWAELSELLSGKYGSAIKYGGGNKKVKRFLRRLSVWIEEFEVNINEDASLVGKDFEKFGLELKLELKKVFENFMGGNV